MEQPKLTDQLAALASTLQDSHPQALPLLRWASLHIKGQDAALAEVREAISKTLEENRHLADGEDCTLIHLVRASANVKVTGLPQCADGSDAKAATQPHLGHIEG